MPDPDYTHLTLVVDRSGSMNSVKDDAQGGIQELFRQQWAQPQKLTLTMVEFDDEVNVVTRMSDKPVDYELVPRGMTALLDAVGSEIARTGEDLRSLPDSSRPGKVLFVVVTDGMENSSTEHTLDAVRKTVERQKNEFSWHFTFIGANESAWQGSGMGMNVTQHSGSAAGTRAVYHAMSDSLLAFRQAPEGTAFAMPSSVTDQDPPAGTPGKAKRVRKATEPPSSTAERGAKSRTTKPRSSKPAS